MGRSALSVVVSRSPASAKESARCEVTLARRRSGEVGIRAPVSLQALTAVWHHSQQKGGDLLVLLALADFADDQNNAWPSVETLAAKARMKERNARYVLRRLEEAGEIELISEGGRVGGRARAATYHVTIAEKGANLAPRQRSVVKGAKSGAERGQPIAPQPSTEPLEPSLVERARKPATVDGKPVTAREHDKADIILGIWNEYAQKPRPYSGVDYRRAIIMRCREHPEMDRHAHRAVIEKNFRNPWWDEPTPNVIYGNSATFERAMNADERPTSKAAKAKAKAERDARGIAAIHRLQSRAA